MADAEEYNSESDSDYVPSEGEEESPTKSRKREAEADEDEVEEANSSKKAKPEKAETEGDVEDLWADFLATAGETPSSSTKDDKDEHQDDRAEKGNKAVPSAASASSPPPPTKTVEQLFEFAGEQIRVEKEVSAEEGRKEAEKKEDKAMKRTVGGGGGGLAALVSNIKPTKLSTLSKSKMDWDKYKGEQKLDEELQTHNRGKDGYMDRQEFLQRTDVRQFERERESRNKTRKNPFS